MLISIRWKDCDRIAARGFPCYIENRSFWRWFSIASGFIFVHIAAKFRSSFRTFAKLRRAKRRADYDRSMSLFDERAKDIARVFVFCDPFRGTASLNWGSLVDERSFQRPLRDGRACVITSLWCNALNSEFYLKIMQIAFLLCRNV